MYVRDTIAAVATPPGPGAIGIVRVSGPACSQIASGVFRRFERRTTGFDSETTEAWLAHRLYHGTVRAQDGRQIDDALAVFMPAPHSYTGEDVFELHCHGSAVVLRTTLEAVLAAGARPAEPGEFTRRAFLNGKLDLTQAEAVMDLVDARTAAGAAQARDQLAGSLSRCLEDIRVQLIRVKAHLEVKIEFADEEVDLNDDDALATLCAVVSNVDGLLTGYESARITRQGVRVAITGAPNVGKSSLLNALLGEDRAIVTAIAGTTRDTIEEGAEFDGVPVILVDTAGLRDSADEAERIGVERARECAAGADVVLAVYDTSVPASGAMEQMADATFGAERHIVVFNKADLPVAWSEAELERIRGDAPWVRTSARTGTGLDDVRRAVLHAVGRGLADTGPVLSRSRQRDAVRKVRTCLAHALDGLRACIPSDLVAADVQAALDHIGAVTGATTSEDVLDAIFAEFCIGK